MGLDVALIAIAAVVIAALLTGAVRKLALSRGVLDIPNKRSSHAAATPRGGGLAIVVVTILAAVALAILGKLQTDLFIALLGGGTAVAAVGLYDDRYRLSPLTRLMVHVAAALWALAWFGGLPPLQVGEEIMAFGWVGYVLGVIGIVWSLNLFNFMDGIDGLAASETAFVAWGGALIALLTGASESVFAIAVIFGAACGGFLLWNWPPARVFMGDVGSGYIGYVVAVLALACARENPAALFVWLILGGVFFVDATATLVRRLIRRERLYEAHRSHAYQWLARRWTSHRRVTVTVTVLNLVWLLPCALLAALYPSRAAWIALGALTPVMALAIAAGSGKREASAA